MRLDLCRDRACADVIESTDVTGLTSARPEAPLEPGIVFWRVTSGACASPTWSFAVGVGDALVDTAWGVASDVDGDGYADAVVTSLDARAAVFAGGPAGLGTAPTGTLGEPGCPTHRWVAAAAGDVDGDGYGDVIIGSFGVAAYLYRGSPEGLRTGPWWTAPAPVGNGYTDAYFARDVAGAGDVDGDGFADVLVATAAPADGTAANLYRGGPTGMDPVPRELHPPSFSMGAWSAAGAGDVNGDGYADVVLGALVGNRIFVYLGSAAGLADEPAATRAEGGTYYAWDAGTAGDVDGDGYADLLVGAANLAATGAVYVYRGGPNGLAEESMTLWSDPWNFGFTVTGADVDADGFADAVVGAGQAGEVYSFPGAPDGLGPPWPRIDVPTGGAWPVGSPGDVDGDTYADILVGDAAVRTVYLYRGGPSGLGASPSAVLRLDYSSFGYSVGSGLGG